MALPTDVAARVRRRVRSTITRLRYRLGWSTLRPGRVKLATGFRHPVDAANEAALVANYKTLFPAAARRELTEADALLRHEFDFLGHRVEHGSAIAWARDPVSQRDWPASYSADIFYRGPKRTGDIKLPWELNKHQYFFTLGKAAWLSGDPRYAREIVRQINNWIDANPCHRGIHWISALEAGTRMVSWILAWPFFANHCDTSSRERMLRSIGQHLLFIERNLSVGPFANTHLAGEAACLVIGALFVDCRHKDRWLRVGLRHLTEQTRAQVRADGVHAEQSIAYHRFFLDQYYLANAFLSVNGRSFTPAVLECMERMTQFLMDAMNPDGSVPAFGDGDDARGIWCHSAAPDDYRASLALGALTFNRGDFKKQAAEPAEELLWLHGVSAIDRFAKLRSVLPDHSSAAYPASGYYLLRSGWETGDSLLSFDCGPLGHGPAGHGHADALSVQLHARGFPFLVDPGTYSYNLDYDWRDRFRSTRSHNTLTVDGLDQSTMKDRMSWATSAQTLCRRWLTTEWFDLVDGEHDGYARLRDPVRHRRIVVFIKPDVWVVCDDIEGEGDHDMEVSLHLHPDCNVVEENFTTILSPPNGGQLRVAMADHNPDDGTKTPVRLEPVEDWHSATYGTKTPSLSLRARQRSAHGWVTSTSLNTGQTNVSIDVTIIGEILRVVRDEPGTRSEQLIYRLHGSAPLKIDEGAFEGDALFHRWSGGKVEVVWSSSSR